MNKAAYLRAFCATTNERNLDRPFSFGAWTYATDGVIALRVPRVDEIPNAGAIDKDSTAAKVSAMPFPADSANGAPTNLCRFPIPTLPAKIFEPCPERVTLGDATCPKTCPECGGTGRVSTVQRVTIGVHDFGSEYLRAMKMFLRGVKTNQPMSGVGRLVFTFEGGSGLLQALKGPLE